MSASEACGCHCAGTRPAEAYPFAYHGPQSLQLPVLHALQGVVDPELVFGIVDLGLVYGVDIEPARTRVTMTLTSAACPVGELIADEVVAALGGVLPAGNEVVVELCWEPPWTPERMSPRARRFMD